MTDADLIEQSLRGRPDAFVEVVERHEVALHGFLARRAGRQVADDLLGEIWARAFAARASYDLACADARPWLYGIARNTLRGHWRSRELPRSGSERRTDPWDGVVERLDSDAATRALVPALAALAPGEREVLLLVAWEQLTPAQAAVALGIPQGTARSRLHRARAALRPVVAGAVAQQDEEEL
ncbi:MAG: RNA polymerase sigma factor [Acidimicrobiales bacterium]